VELPPTGDLTEFARGLPKRGGFAAPPEKGAAMSMDPELESKLAEVLEAERDLGATEEASELEEAIEEAEGGEAPAAAPVASTEEPPAEPAEAPAEPAEAAEEPAEAPATT